MSKSNRIKIAVDVYDVFNLKKFRNIDDLKNQFNALVEDLDKEEEYSEGYYSCLDTITKVAVWLDVIEDGEGAKIMQNASPYAVRSRYWGWEEDQDVDGLNDDKMEYWKWMIPAVGKKEARRMHDDHHGHWFDASCYKREGGRSYWQGKVERMKAMYHECCRLRIASLDHRTEGSSDILCFNRESPRIAAEKKVGISHRMDIPDDPSNLIQGFKYRSGDFLVVDATRTHYKLVEACTTGKDLQGKVNAHREGSGTILDTAVKWSSHHDHERYKGTGKKFYFEFLVLMPISKDVGDFWNKISDKNPDPFLWKKYDQMKKDLLRDVEKENLQRQKQGKHKIQFKIKELRMDWDLYWAPHNDMIIDEDKLRLYFWKNRLLMKHLIDIGMPAGERTSFEEELRRISGQLPKAS
jgi:hypothetical protein